MTQPRRVATFALLLMTGAERPGGAECGVACDSGVWVATVATVQDGPWQREGRTRRREIALQLHVDRVLKGPRASAVVATRAIQHESASSRVFAVPGVWSGLDVATRTSWVLFLRAPARTGRRELAENEIRQVLPAHAAADDAAFVLEPSRARLPLSKLIAQFSGQTLNFGEILGDDLLARAEAAVRSDPVGFTSLVRLLEQPGLPLAFRRQVFGGLVDALARRDFGSKALAASLALTGFRLMSAPDTGPMAGSLRQTWLPALLGLERATARLSPATVFAGAPADSARAAAMPELGDELRVWFDGHRE